MSAPKHRGQGTLPRGGEAGMDADSKWVAPEPQLLPIPPAAFPAIRTFSVYGAESARAQCWGEDGTHSPPTHSPLPSVLLAPNPSSSGTYHPPHQCSQLLHCKCIWNHTAQWLSPTLLHSQSNDGKDSKSISPFKYPFHWLIFFLILEKGTKLERTASLCYFCFVLFATVIHKTLKISGTINKNWTLSPVQSSYSNLSNKAQPQPPSPSCYSSSHLGHTFLSSGDHIPKAGSSLLLNQNSIQQKPS